MPDRMLSHASVLLLGSAMAGGLWVAGAGEQGWLGFLLAAALGDPRAPMARCRRPRSVPA